MRDKLLNKIINIIVNETKPNKIILFGSRAKGLHKISSDYDLLVDASKIDIRKRRKINDFIEDISGLYKVDLLFAKEVDKTFINLIAKYGKVVYER